MISQINLSWCGRVAKPFPYRFSSSSSSSSSSSGSLSTSFVSLYMYCSLLAPSVPARGQVRKPLSRERSCAPGDHAGPRLLIPEARELRKNSRQHESSLMAAHLLYVDREETLWPRALQPRRVPRTDFFNLLTCQVATLAEINNFVLLSARLSRTREVKLATLILAASSIACCDRGRIRGIVCKLEESIGTDGATRHCPTSH